MELMFPQINNLFYYFSGYVGYLVLGYFLSTRITSIYSTKKIGAFLFIAGVFITMFATFYVSLKRGKFTHMFYTYLTPNVLLASTGIFLYIKSIKTRKNMTLNFISRNIVKYSFGIYLSHVFVLAMLKQIGIYADFINPIIGVPITTLLCLILSFLITFILNKIPYIGKYISG